jgi:hypothetical protein
MKNKQNSSSDFSYSRRNEDGSVLKSGHSAQKSANPDASNSHFTKRVESAYPNQSWNLFGASSRSPETGFEEVGRICIEKSVQRSDPD